MVTPPINADEATASDGASQLNGVGRTRGEEVAVTRAAGTFARLEALIARGIAEGLDLVTGKDVGSIQAFVDSQRRLHPKLANDPGTLADRIIQKRQWYGAATSFAWGLGGWFTLVPNVAHIWRIQGRLVLSIAYVYGYDITDPERREDIALCFALSSAKEAVSQMLKDAGMIGVKRALLTQTSKQFIKALPRRLATIAGTKSLTNVSKVVPIAGGIVGGIVDFFSTRGVGKAAKAFYS